jgi:hypothetical protein
MQIDDLRIRNVPTLEVGNYPHLRVDGDRRHWLTSRVSPRRHADHGIQHDVCSAKTKFKETSEIDMAYGVAGWGASV